MLVGTSIAALALIPVPALSQTVPADPTSPQASDAGLAEIVVTAQKREQSLQDVPVAITALTGDMLVANRVTNIVDLSAIAPGFTVRPSLGGSAIPFIASRGALSGTVVPGADRQISIYLDGAYVQAVRGSIFDLPDLERIEVLRGPQGTLFGRNATAGAISISTRDPRGELGVKASASIGNLESRRFRLTLDTPQFGPFSAYVSFVHDEARGYTRNALGGITYDFTNGLAGQRKITSSDWLGGRNFENWFAALKFDPGGDFTATYKFDRSDGGETNPPLGILGTNPANPFSSLYNALLATGYSSPLILDLPQTHRPNIVYNGLNSRTDQFQEGHNLRMEWKITDSFSVRNIAAYRRSGIFSSSDVLALNGLTFTPEVRDVYQAFFGPVPATLIGSPFLTVGHTPLFDSKQWSEELQANYTSDFVTLTAGGLYFESKENVNHHGYQNSIAFEPVPNGIFPVRPGIAFNKQVSIAAYAQGEFHVTPQIDVVLGGRVTHDDKEGTFSYGTLTSLKVFSSSYKDTRFTYLVGVNYKPDNNTLIYGKWSTGYVSGGAVGPVPYAPETATSAEFGVKADLFDRKLRTNLAVYWVRYKDLQSTAAVSTLGSLVDELTGDPALTQVFGTFILPQGTATSKGIELEVTAAPVRGLTIGGSLAYNHTKVRNVPSFAKRSVGLLETDSDDAYTLPFRPDWTGSLYGQFDTEALFGDAYLSFRLDGLYQGRMPAYQNQNLGIPAVASALAVPSYWLVNGRLALRSINFGGTTAELALWGKNILDEDTYTFPIIAAGTTATNYVPARTYGLELSVEF